MYEKNDSALQKRVHPKFSFSSCYFCHVTMLLCVFPAVSDILPDAFLDVTCDRWHPAVSAPSGQERTPGMLALNYRISARFNSFKSYSVSTHLERKPEHVVFLLLQRQTCLLCVLLLRISSAPQKIVLLAPSGRGWGGPLCSSRLAAAHQMQMAQRALA